MEEEAGAYDSRPHTWKLECLEMYKINRTLGAFIINSVGKKKEETQSKLHKLPSSAAYTKVIH